MLKDRLGRTIDNLRVSVTDRCNFRCTYCMPEQGLEWLPRDEILTFEEIHRFVRIAAGLGIRKIRLTGGEPLLRRNLPELVRRLTSLPDIEDVSLTTNGLLLAAHAEALAAAGLRRVNVSLDSLDEKTFLRLARRGTLDTVLEGLDAARRHFGGPVKVNAVILRGVNDHELARFAEFARGTQCEMRFIEFMPLDADNRWTREALISGEEIRAAISHRFPLVPDPDCRPQSPSRDYVFADGQGGKVGFINSVTEPFCGSCNRIRITADGNLRTCLFSAVETNLKPLLRGDASDEKIGEMLQRAVWEKEPGHKIGLPGFVPASRSMSQIGG